MLQMMLLTLSVLSASVIWSVRAVEPVAVPQYVEYIESTGLRIILSAPHGGEIYPGSIPDRDAGCWDNVRNQCIWSHTCGTKNETKCKATTDGDLFTQELTREVHQRLCTLFQNVCPAAILNRLGRSKFDANRDIDEATFGVSVVVEAFERYHILIEQEQAKMGDIGLFIDIHGHGHKAQRAELGYLVRGKDLDSGSPIDPKMTSIRSLAERATVQFDDLLRGRDSFGGILGTYNFDSVPSPKYRGPGNLTYFNGGYNTRRHGSFVNGTFDAIQIESARSHRDPPMRSAYARALACTIGRYYCQYYNHSQGGASVATTFKTVSDACAKLNADDSDCRAAANKLGERLQSAYLLLFGLLIYAANSFAL